MGCKGCKYEKKNDFSYCSGCDRAYAGADSGYHPDKYEREEFKPKMIGHRNGEPVYECGQCEATLVYAHQAYCMICGCKNDWSKETD